MNGQLGVMEAAQRPWVSVAVTLAEPPRLTAWGGQKGINVSLRFELKNYGTVPAVNARIESPIVLHPGNIKRSELDVPQKEACDRARASSDANPIGGVTVFPGVPVFVEQGTGISGVYKTDDPVLFSILGCVDYTYLGNRHGQTGFRMLLGHVDKGRIYGIPFVEGKPHPYEEPVPPELLAHGYPTDPPKEYLLQPNEFVFQPEDSGNYAR